MKEWKDEKTGLIWAMEKSEKILTWKKGLEYAASLEKGYRVPEIEELETLLDRELYDPAMRIEVPFRDSLHYWSSTTYANYTSHAGRVNFSNGYVAYYDKSYNNYVRCVRSGQ